MQPYRTTTPTRKDPPSNRRVAWARRRRQELIALLGGQCVDCGTTSDLEFDHTHPRDWEPRKLNRWHRMSRYWRDYLAGILTIRCRSCNARKGYPAGQEELLASRPF